MLVIWHIFWGWDQSENTISEIKPPLWPVVSNCHRKKICGFSWVETGCAEMKLLRKTQRSNNFTFKQNVENMLKNANFNHVPPLKSLLLFQSDLVLKDLIFFQRSNITAGHFALYKLKKKRRKNFSCILENGKKGLIWKWMGFINCHDLVTIICHFRQFYKWPFITNHAESKQ